VVRLIFAAALGALAVSGCATTNTPYARPVYSTPVGATPSAPNPYRNVARATLHSELFTCGSWGSNLGEIGMRSEFVQYSPYIDTPAGPLLRTPTEGACLSSGFGWRSSVGAGRPHNGVDLANPNGGYIYAAAEGRITYADYRNGFGNVIEIDHGRGVRTLYAHLAEINPDVYAGAHVYDGAAIGRMGMTGNATGVHLHYEVFVEGMIVDPLHYGRPPTFVSAPAPAQPMLDPVDYEAKPAE
jgi:murein DD-endopeptidase MepM/ murein hydrolase activator NlpD